VPPIFLPQFLLLADFRRLADVPLEIEWFANIDNAQTPRPLQPHRGRPHP
jgi:hypothetical protein